MTDSLKVFTCLLLAMPFSVGAQQASKQETFTVPVAYYKLPNGLRVVLSRDTTAPTVVIAVYYRIGFRIEPKDRTGFAHLFEHMMFQGSRNLGKMEFIKLVEQNGGVLNGSTRFDFTNYFELLPANKLETALWAESDRMKGLAITEDNLKNQQGVVGNEVKVNVINQPYGGFPWLWIPQYANTNWYNSHNFYGELKDIEAAKLDEVQSFFKTYYAPNNAALVIVGDFEAEAAKSMIEKYFGPIPASKVPSPPDLTEPRQEKEKAAVREDPLANRPALAFAYHVPPRNSPEYYAMGLLDQMLVQGDDSLLYEELVKKRGYTGEVSGGINVDLGDMFDYDGPMLWTAYLIHDASVKPDQILESVDNVIDSLQSQPVSQKLLDRSVIKMRSHLYDSMTQFGGFGRANLLACFALFDDDPSKINALEANFRSVTPELAQRTAREYLRKTNRTVLILKPGAVRSGPASARGAR
ncbi:MAG: insulinase family protein [Acidobacteriaceae bacterium]|nr:insulinase family protein [Acidobacteriaceae bacterium]MBV9780290.1 insulinase family protein [Acidobacteriaceae bacterium]